jgi:hypothetical protein
MCVQTTDVYINAKTHWRNVPSPVWDFSIGGYPVLKKWLSYRDQRVLNRELEEFQKIARRITSILLLSPELNAAYQCTKARAVEWPPLFKKAHVVVLALWVNLKEVVLSIFTRNRKEQNDDKAIRQDSG